MCGDKMRYCLVPEIGDKWALVVYQFAYNPHTMAFSFYWEYTVKIFNSKLLQSESSATVFSPLDTQFGQVVRVQENHFYVIFVWLNCCRAILF
jgi:hypothetical protein